MTKILEVKHELGQPLSVRTRALGTVVPGCNPLVKNVFVAKGGVSPPPDCADHNRYFVDLVFNRTPDTKYMTRPFHSIREQWVTAGDVFQVPHEVRANLDYDFKRRPVSPYMVTAGDGSGLQQLTFSTEPWVTLMQGEQARDYFKEWRDQGRCLKSMADWGDWEDYYLSKVALDTLRVKLKLKRLPLQVTTEGSRGILKRVFVRAYVREAWGLRHTMTYAEVRDVLASFDCPVTANDVKNGNKAELLPNMVPRTPRTKDLLGRLMLAFDGLDCSKVFIAD